jgi:hypothetical protein
MPVGAIANDWSHFLLLFVSANDSTNNWGSRLQFLGKPLPPSSNSTNNWGNHCYHRRFLPTPLTTGGALITIVAFVPLCWTLPMAGGAIANDWGSFYRQALVGV